MQESYHWGFYKPHGLVLNVLDLINFKIKIRAVKRTLTKLLSKAWPVFDVEYMGSRFRCYVRDNSTERNMVFIHNNPPKSELITALDSLRQGDTFVDIGANCGLFTILGAQKVGEEGRVLAIEPNEIMLERLNYNIAINNLKNIELLNLAVGPEAGTVELYINRKQYGRSSIIDDGNNDKTVVEMDSLKEIVRKSNVDNIDLLKIDIEGYEFYALKPFFEEATHSIWPKKVLIEISHSDKAESDPVKYLISKGYRIAWTGKNDALLQLQ